jgi:hypothetical protein
MECNLDWFAREVLKRPLYPYQMLVGDAILGSVLYHSGLTFSVMFARQMGKNQLSAILEAYLLACMEEGCIVKVAPTFKPQTVNSRLRLLTMLDNPLTAWRIRRSYGYIVGVAPSSKPKSAQPGPRVLFFSAAPEANIVGATASLLLEIDEAQDVSIQKFNRDLRPMASTTAATTVLYGTAWSDDTLLATVRANNLALEERDGIQRHFEFDWRTLATINPSYKRFVEGEIERLGEDHPTIRTQYRLLPISSAGFLLNEMQRVLLQGIHDWEKWPDGESVYIAGMDIGGEERTASDDKVLSRQHDSTVITIGKVIYNDVQLPGTKIVCQYWWTGKTYLEQYAETVAICERWNVRKLVVDKTGLGEGMASLLMSKFGEERVLAFHFSRSSKSKLTYQLLSMINAGCLKIYRADEAPYQIYRECWKQLTSARYRVPGQNILDMYVDAAEGHDDFLISIALCCEALRNWAFPAISEIQIVKPPAWQNDGWY